MKKILFLTPELPYPPVSGGKLKSWKFLEFLTSHYKVAVGSILKENDEEHVEEFLANIKISNFFSCPVKRSRSIVNLFKSYVHQMPLNLYRTYSPEFTRQINNVIDDYDMIISDHYEVFQYIPSDYPGKVILHEHNAYYLMWERYAQSSENSLAKRLVSILEATRVKNYEKLACLRSDRIFASPNDIESLVLLGISREKFRYTYHLGDDTQLQLPSIQYAHTSKSLLYVGSLGWEANIDGLLWFIDSVWPELLLKHPDLTFTIIGKNPDQRIIDAAKPYPTIKFTGFVDILDPYFQTHRVFIAPLRFGAGMKVKVLNAMCRGIPTVTTSVGSEGMEVEHLKHLAVCDSEPEMIKSIDTLLTNEIVWKRLERHSRALITQKYTWKALFSAMKTTIDQTLSSYKPSIVLPVATNINTIRRTSTSGNP